MSPEAQTLVEKGRIARREGRAGKALDRYRAALALCTSEDPSARAYCLRHIGDIAHEIGDPRGARIALVEAEAIYRELGNDAVALANTLRLLALASGNADLWREARDLYAHAAERTGLPLEPAIAECDRHLPAA